MAILRCFFSSEFDICVFFVSILLNRLLCCKLIFARLFFTNHVCFAFSSLVRSHVLLSSLKRLVCCFHTSFFPLFSVFFSSFIHQFALILQSLVGTSICWLGYYPLSCRCLLGNESEKYVIENLYDFDLAIITITIEHTIN